MRVCKPCKGQVQGGGARVRRRCRRAGGDRTRLESGEVLFAAAGGLRGRGPLAHARNSGPLAHARGSNPLFFAVIRRIGAFCTRAGAATGGAGTPSDRTGAPSDRAGMSPRRAGTPSDRTGMSPRRAGTPSGRVGASSGRAGASPRRAGMHPERSGLARGEAFSTAPVPRGFPRLPRFCARTVRALAKRNYTPLRSLSPRTGLAASRNERGPVHVS